MGYDSTINPNFQQALYQVPVAQQDATRVAPVQQPISFQGTNPETATAQVAEKKGGLSLGKILGLGLLTVGAIGAHKTSALSKEFKALQSAEGSTIAKTAEYKFGSNFLHNCNPLNWFGNGKTAEVLESTKFKKIGESGRFVQNGEDVLQISGKNIRGLDGKVSEDANAFLIRAKELKDARASLKGPIAPILSPEDKKYFTENLEGLNSLQLKELLKLELAKVSTPEQKAQLEKIYAIAIKRAELYKIAGTAPPVSSTAYLDDVYEGIGVS